jgi:hypothetical protein
MAFIIYNKKTTLAVKKCISYRAFYVHEFATEQGAKSYLTRKVNAKGWNRDDYAIADSNTFYSEIEKKETVINMMSGKPVEQGVNTPLCCDVSSETYWCM